MNITKNFNNKNLKLAALCLSTVIVSPSAQKVSVYLHYTKNIDTQVEAVEFVLNVGSERSTIDHLEDGTVEAYTLFCSFTANSSTFSNMILHFESSMSNEELKKAVISAHEETVIFDGSVSLGGTINLSESFRNFYELEILVDNVYSRGRVLTSALDDGSSCDIATIGAAMIADSVDMWFDMHPIRLAITNEVSMTYTNAFNIKLGNGIYGGDKKPITKIIGIGRKI